MPKHRPGQVGTLLTPWSAAEAAPPPCHSADPHAATPSQLIDSGARRLARLSARLGRHVREDIAARLVTSPGRFERVP
jgi:hypothetical protein